MRHWLERRDQTGRVPALMELTFSWRRPTISKIIMNGNLCQKGKKKSGAGLKEWLKDHIFIFSEGPSEVVALKLKHEI